MTDADKAYQIAEERIEQAKQYDMTLLSLSGSAYSYKDSNVVWQADEKLRSLKKIPASIKQLADLEQLYLHETNISSLENLRHLRNLKVLSAGDTKISRLEEISELSSLEELILDSTSIASIANLRNLRKIRALVIANTRVSDISIVGNMPEITTLNLSKTQVVDLDPLRNLNKLEALYLDYSRGNLLQLVDEGASWQHADLNLADLRFKFTPFEREGCFLAGLHEKYQFDSRTKAALAALRAERDRRKVAALDPPAIAPAPAHGHIFLSYSREDASKAQHLRNTLEKDGVTIWQDVDMAIGTRFRGEIDTRIASAAAVLVLWTEASATSDYIQSEAERARLADKLTPALLATVTPPPPFDAFNTADLSGWSGDKNDPEYQRLLSTLRAALTPNTPSGVKADNDGALAVEAEPINAPYANRREDQRAEALRAQTRLAALLADEALHANAHPRLEPRLRAYLDDLSDAKPLWSNLDGVFAGIAPLLGDDGLDEGLKGMAAKVISDHSALKPFFTKESAPDDPDWPDLAPDQTNAAAAALETAADALATGPFGEAVPQFLRDGVSIIEAAQEEAFEGPDAEERARKSGGRAVYVALGVLSSTSAAILDAAGSASSVATYLATEAGQSLFFVLGAAWQTLMRLVGLM